MISVQNSLSLFFSLLAVPGQYFSSIHFLAQPRVTLTGLDKLLLISLTLLITLLAQALIQILLVSITFLTLLSCMITFMFLVISIFSLQATSLAKTVKMSCLPISRSIDSWKTSSIKSQGILEPSSLLKKVLRNRVVGVFSENSQSKVGVSSTSLLMTILQRFMNNNQSLLIRIRLVLFSISGLEFTVWKKQLTAMTTLSRLSDEFLQR